MKKNKSMISRFQDLLETQKGQTILNYLYSWGAAVVILGALFKLTHIEGADLMLFLGMGTEVITFIVNGFERQSSVKDSVDTSIAAAGPVVIGGTPIVGSMVTGSSDAVSGEIPQIDTDALNAMANIAAANAALAAAQGAQPQLDTDALNDMANLAATNAALVAAQSTQAVVPIIEGKVDIPELQQVTQDYIDKLRELTESFQHISVQSNQLEASADEVDRLSRNLTSINTIYEMHLKSLGSQIGNIDLVNEQTRRMAEQIEELNRVYDRMLQSMTVNMNINRHADEPSKEA